MTLNASGKTLDNVATGNEAKHILSVCSALWRLLRPSARGRGKAFLIAFLMSLGGIGAAFCGPYFLAVLLDEALPARDLDLFRLYAAAVVFSLLAFFVFSCVKTRFLGTLTEEVFLSLRTRIVGTLLRKPMNFFLDHTAGDMITRVSNDSEHLSLLIFDYAYAGVNGLITILFFTSVMIAWEWRLGIYTALTLPCYVLILSCFQKPLTRAAKAARAKLSEQNETMLDVLSGNKEIRIYQQYAEAARRYGDAASHFTRANIRSVLIGEWAYNTMETFARGITVLPFLLGGYWICRGESSISTGVLIAYNLYLTYIAFGLEVINVGMSKLAQASPLVQRIRELLDSPEEEIESGASSREWISSTCIEYRDVWYGFGPDKPLHRGFSLTVEPGEKLALMGPSGAGKSTLIELLTRQRVPDGGDILLGGLPIREFSLPRYLLYFAYVSQNPYIFSTSVRENISMGWYHVPMDIIVDTARRVRIHDDIMRLPQGYDSVIGRGGVELSGGQKQRLALARALVRDPEILLLDEFTSALDSAAEAAILDDLFLHFRKQTVICVTHSIAVARRFDRVVTLEKP